MLRLRPPRDRDETEFRAGHAELAADDFTFGLRLEPGMSWAEYLRLLGDERLGRNLPDGLVPSTFLVADIDGQVVGRSSIRHELNEVLRDVGGHIGYAVRPAYRRRGHATEILRQSLVVARSVGIDRVLMICDDDNAGSAAVIESCGGKLDTIRPATADSVAKRRYWID